MTCIHSICLFIGILQCALLIVIIVLDITYLSTNDYNVGKIYMFDLITTMISIPLTVTNVILSVFVLYHITITACGCTSIKNYNIFESGSCYFYAIFSVIILIDLLNLTFDVIIFLEYEDKHTFSIIEMAFRSFSILISALWFYIIKIAYSSIK